MVNQRKYPLLTINNLQSTINNLPFTINDFKKYAAVS